MTSKRFEMSESLRERKVAGETEEEEEEEEEEEDLEFDRKKSEDVGRGAERPSRA
jgi:hypothetical protein